MMKFGDILSELREDKGLTQRKLSEILHISNSSISAFETNRRVPNIEHLTAFAQFFNVTTDYLLGLTSSTLPSSVLSEPLSKSTRICDVVEALKSLSPTQRDAILLVLENMRFYTEVAGRAGQSEGRTK